MQVGIIGVGTVGGTLKRYFEEHTKHTIKCYDPHKHMHDNLHGCDAIFISVPVPSLKYGQDLKAINDSVNLAKKFTQNVFIRSTVLPGTNDSFGTIAMPEFLTARRAYEDMVKLPLIFGDITNYKLIEELFPNKEYIQVSNTEAELAKFTHNCFGAFKVTYFNMIKKLCDFKGANFEHVKKAANITGYLGQEHMQVPGHDGKLGYGGTCFPVNMESLQGYLELINSHSKLKADMFEEESLIKQIRKLNFKYRGSDL